MPFVLSLTDEDLEVAPEDTSEELAIARVQTRGLGSKQSAVSWLPRSDGAAIVAAGSWDEPTCELSL